jgi:anti-sigma regulatory factor (Ser/Thr protein kinase)/anti-anti-sigma regulatory factor
MDGDGDAIGRIPLQISRECVVASIQVDLDEAVLRQFRDDLLGLLHQSGLVAVILDVSGVDLMDGEDFRALRKIVAMSELMGSRCIIAGLRPGVVASLVELDVELEDLETTLNLDAAFAALEASPAQDSLVDRSSISTKTMALSRKTRVPVARETDVARAVVQASRLAKDHQLPENDANRLATAVSELARNIIKYAGSGEVLIGGTTHSSGRQGIEVVVRDRGPGIADLDTAPAEPWVSDFRVSGV